MINNLLLLRNLGTFENAAGGGFPFGRLTTIYAENAKGKTTLAAVFRSLASGDVTLITERHRFGAQHQPELRIAVSVGGNAVFENGAWTRTLPEVSVFDDLFVDENIHSGLAVDPMHRQKLHELILGKKGVALHDRYQDLIRENDGINAELGQRAQAIPAAARGPYPVDQFVSLGSTENIDHLIQEATRALAAAREQEPIRQRAAFTALTLPAFHVAGIEHLLGRNLPALEAEAAARVQEHLARLGAGGENWVADGMRRIGVHGQAGDQPCPFCAQLLQASPVINHYRAYFSEGYTGLKRDVSQMQVATAHTHGGDAQLAFERSVRVAGEARAFWAPYCDVPAINLDTEKIARDWREARELVLEALHAKQASPLDAAKLSDAAKAAIEKYHQHSGTVATLNVELVAVNGRIQQVKANAAAGNVVQLAAELARLKAQKARQEAANIALCEAYQRVVDAKAKNERERTAAREALERYRAEVFPAVQEAVNRYLASFSASFRLADVAGVNAGGRSACNYSLVINETHVAIEGGRVEVGRPTFKNTLSAGDRNTLALAFFLATIDLDEQAANKVVVVDDPFSSLDAHRATITTQELRRLAGRVAQVVVLSHNKQFLSSLWNDADRHIRASLQVRRAGASSILAAWDVTPEDYASHDQRHELMRAYNGNPAQALAVAQALRPTLERFLRVAYPESCPPGMMIGGFVGLCEERQAAGNPILSADDLNCLRDLNEYSGQFHHPNYDANAPINDGELIDHIGRVLRFTRRPQ